MVHKSLDAILQLPVTLQATCKNSIARDRLMSVKFSDDTPMPQHLQHLEFLRVECTSTGLVISDAEMRSVFASLPDSMYTMIQINQDKALHVVKANLIEDWRLRHRNEL